MASAALPSTAALRPVLTTLPYETLGGDAFERLIYDILVAQSFVPQRIRRSGFRQYGVDLQVSTASGGLTLYECKNRRPVKPADLAAWLKKFEDDWIGKAHLRRPDELVICCPIDIDAIQWRRQADAFHARTGVAAVLWNGDYIDSLLRDLPQIVAAFFGDATASLFCNDWNDSSLCVPVGTVSEWRRFTGTHRKRIGDAVTRYHRAKVLQRLVIPQALRQQVEGLFASPPPYRTLLVRGPAGSGKSVTALALSAEKAAAGFRCYYTSLKWADSLAEIRQAIRRRARGPTIFIIDDCDQGIDLTDSVYEKVVAALELKSEVWFVLLRRSVQQSETWATSDVEQTLMRDGAVVDLRPSREVFRDIVERRFERAFAISDAHVDGLWSVTGGDLLLLDTVTESIHSAQDLDSLTLDSVLPIVQKTYFPDGMERYDTVEYAAALAQFDVTPFTAAFGQPAESERASLRLLATIEGLPNRYTFSHSSMAELAFRTVLARRGGKDIDDVAALRVAKYVENDDLDVPTRAGHLAKVLTATRKLPGTDDGRFRKTLLCGAALRFVETHLLRFESAANLGTILHGAVVEGCLEAYATELGKRLRDRTLIRRFSQMTGLSLLLAMIRQPPFASFAAALRESTDEALLSELASSLLASDFLQLVATLHDDSRSASSILMQAGPLSFAPQVYSGLAPAIAGVVAVDPDAEAALLAGSDLAAIAAAVLDARRLRPILRFLAAVPPAFAAGVAQRFGDEQLDQFVSAERASGGTNDWLNIVMFRLISTKRADVIRGLCERLGPRRLNAILSASTTFVGHLRVIHRMPPDLRAGMVESMDDELIDEIVNRAAAVARLFDTAKFAFRDLRDESMAVADAFHRKIGIPRYLRLLRECGTVYGLEALMVYLPGDMVATLAAGIDDSVLDALIDRMIERKTGLSALGATTKTAHPHRNVRFLVAGVIGAARLGRLVAAIGSLGDLIHMAMQLQPQGRVSFVESVLTQTTLDALIARISGTTGSIVHSFQKLEYALPLREYMETLLGVDGFLAIVMRIGGFHHVSRLIGHLSDDLRRRVLSDDRLLTVLRPLQDDNDLSTLAAFARAHGALMPGIDPAGSPLLLSVGRHVEQAQWWAVNRACHIVDQGADSQIRRVFHAAMERRARAAGSEDLGFCENANRLSMRMRFGIADTSELARDWPSCLPATTEEWESRNALAAANVVTDLLMRYGGNRAAILSMLNQRALAGAIAASERTSVTYFLWQLHELAHEEGISVEAFSNWLDVAIRDAVLKRGLTRLGKVGAGDIIDAVALIGLLSYLRLWNEAIGPHDRQRLSTLLNTASVRPFISSFFLVSGARALGILLAPPMRRRLTAGMDSYSHPTASRAYAELQSHCRILLPRLSLPSHPGRGLR